MKKWSTALLLLTLANSAFASKDPFTGLYGGIYVGLIQDKVDVNFVTTSFVPDALNLMFSKSSSDGTDTDLMGGVGLGYSIQATDFFLVGIEGRANFQDLHINQIDDHNELSSGFLVTTMNQYRLKNDFALLAKLGITLDPRFLLYGLIGPDLGKIQFNNDSIISINNGQANGSNEYNISRHKLGLLLGLGTEILTTKCTTIALEYNYTTYQEMDVTNPITSVIEFEGTPVEQTIFSNYNINVKLKTNKIMAKFNYFFL